jgi:hypothetical protein
MVVDSTGRVFWDFTDKKVRKAVIEEMGTRYKVAFSPEQVQRFVNLGAIGIPMQQLPAYLDLKEPDRTEGGGPAVSKGIPIDSTNNQLLDWIRTTQLIFSSGAEGRNPIVALKGDGNVNIQRDEQGDQDLPKPHGEDQPFQDDHRPGRKPDDRLNQMTSGVYSGKERGSKRLNP